MTVVELSRQVMRWWRAARFNIQPTSASILERIQGTAPITASGRCCIFAHYDPQGIIDPYVTYYIKNLRKLDADIVFVTTSAALRAEDIATIRPLCRTIVRRANVSADFGSWHAGLHILSSSTSQYRQLILSNDSVYGPFHDLSPIFRDMDARGLDLWGLTQCAEEGLHLQSYFLVFQRSAFDSAFFHEFWNGFRHESRKRRLIRKYEIGLSRHAREHALNADSWISEQQLDWSRNVTLFNWEQLIEELGFPFLKQEILRINRFGSTRASEWRKIINSTSNYDCNLIADHLRRVGSAVPLDAWGGPPS